MFCRMLAWRTVAAPDVPTLRASTETKTKPWVAWWSERGLAALALSNGSVQVWDVRSNRFSRVLTSGLASARTPLFLRDANALIARGPGFEIVRWNLADGRVESEFR